MLTWKVPGFVFVDIDDADGVAVEESTGDAALEVEADEFFVGGVESEAR